jgi:hypothetical protein
MPSNTLPVERDERTIDWVEEDRPNRRQTNIDMDAVLTLASTPMNDPAFNAALANADLPTLQAVLREQHVLMVNREIIADRIHSLQSGHAEPLPSVREMIGTAPTESESGPMVVSAGENVPAAVRKKVLLAELQGLVKQSVATHFEIGRRLTELQALSERGEFLKTLQGPLWGFSPASAYQHINFYEKCQALPRLRDLAEGNFTKAIALFNTLEGEQLEAFARGELPQLTAEEFDEMSVSQLKKELKKLKKDVGTIVKEETKGLVQERDALIKERDAALAQLESPDWKRVREHAAEAAKLAEKLGAQVGVLLDSMPKDQPIPTELSFGIEASLFRAHTAAQTAWSRFEALKGEEE